MSSMIHLDDNPDHFPQLRLLVVLSVISSTTAISTCFLTISLAMATVQSLHGEIVRGSSHCQGENLHLRDAHVVELEIRSGRIPRQPSRIENYDQQQNEEPTVIAGRGTVTYVGAKQSVKMFLCMQGPPGPPGPPGVDGTPGLDGRNGTDGANGTNGPRDLLSSATCACKEGPPGSPGPPGEKGPTGGNGTRGADGNPGKVGEPGVPGFIGPVGTPGVAGPKGPPGDPGLATTVLGNAPGPLGPPGPPGPKGVTGEPGRHGKPGQPGSRENGEPGEMGPPGAPGPLGQIGSQGFAGPSATCVHCPKPFGYP